MRPAASCASRYCARTRLGAQCAACISRLSCSVVIDKARQLETARRQHVAAHHRAGGAGGAWDLSPSQQPPSPQQPPSSMTAPIRCAAAATITAGCVGAERARRVGGRPAASAAAAVALEVLLHLVRPGVWRRSESSDMTTAEQTTMTRSGGAPQPPGSGERGQCLAQCLGGDGAESALGGGVVGRHHIGRRKIGSERARGG